MFTIFAKFSLETRTAMARALFDAKATGAPEVSPNHLVAALLGTDDVVAVCNLAGISAYTAAAAVREALPAVSSATTHGLSEQSAVVTLPLSKESRIVFDALTQAFQGAYEASVTPAAVLKAVLETNADVASYLAHQGITPAVLTRPAN